MREPNMNSLRLLIILSALYSSLISAQTEMNNSEPLFENKLDSLVKYYKFPIGIAFFDLKNGFGYFNNEDVSFPTASAIKIEILVELFEQASNSRFKLTDQIDIKIKVGGGGILQYFDYKDLKLSYYNLALLMIQQSDNTATNILIEKLGMREINNSIQRYGLKNTKLQRVMMDFEARKQGRDNISTPKDKLTLLEKIYKGEILSKETCKKILELLSIPKSSTLAQNIKDGFKLAGKGGEIPEVRCEMGIFYFDNFDYILVVMTKDLPDQKLGDKVISDISTIVYNHMLSRNN
jgi:beta-lactamase class A